MDKKPTQSNPPTPEKPPMSPISSFPTIEESDDEHEICHEYLTEKEHHQLLLDEEALRETLEEEAKAEKQRAKAEKEWEEFVKQELAHDELFRLEFKGSRGDFGEGMESMWIMFRVDFIGKIMGHDSLVGGCFWRIGGERLLGVSRRMGCCWRLINRILLDGISGFEEVLFVDLLGVEGCCGVGVFGCGFFSLSLVGGDGESGGCVSRGVV
ncbi:hypothetical protein Tco_0091612 [Tanacetum coccineum]